MKLSSDIVAKAIGEAIAEVVSDEGDRLAAALRSIAEARDVDAGLQRVGMTRENLTSCVQDDIFRQLATAAGVSFTVEFGKAGAIRWRLGAWHPRADR